MKRTFCLIVTLIILLGTLTMLYAEPTGKISTRVKNALEWAYSAGIIAGKDNKTAKTIKLKNV